MKHCHALNDNAKHVSQKSLTCELQREFQLRIGPKTNQFIDSNVQWLFKGNINFSALNSHFTDQRCLIVIDPKNKIGFCRNPKVSSSTWLTRFKILLDNLNFSHKFTPEEVINFHEVAHAWWNLTKSKKMALLKRQRIFSFIFVRHPLERLESAYYDKIVGDPSPHFQKLTSQIKRKCE